MTELHGDPATSGEAQQSVMNRRTFAQAAVGVAAAAGAAGLVRWSVVRHNDEGAHLEHERVPTHAMTATRLSGAVPRDPTHASWQDLPGIEVGMMQQFMVAPRLKPEGMIPSVSLRALHNGTEIGMHVSWTDSGSDDLESAGRFRDAVAVQFPSSAQDHTNTVMGQPGRPVHMLLWRASWQRTVKGGPKKVSDIHPNMVNDFTPEDRLGERAKAHYPALAIGNPLALRERKTAVEELVAEGFGTVTTHATQRAEGTGVYSGGRWMVAIVFPMQGKDGQVNLRPGQTTTVAAAVWDGAKGDRGARKQFAPWTSLRLDA